MSATPTSATPVIPAPLVPAAFRSSRARVPLDPPTGLIGRALNFYAKRKYGQVLDNLLELAHNRRVLMTDARFELSVARWNRLDPQLKALAVTGSRRDPTLPDVPTLTEFLPGLDLRPWMSVVAPAGTPAPILGKLNSEINKALADRDFVQRLRQVGVEPTPLTVAAFDDFIRSDSSRWAELVKISGAKAE